MKKIKKLLILSIAAAMTTSVAIGCGNAGGKLTKDASDWYIDYKPNESVAYNVDANYNQDLYYLNEFKYKLADPTVIYVNEGEEKGYFYAYGTSDLVHGYGIQCWRSKDLTNWEYKTVAYTPDFDECWDYKNHWAPEVLYDADLEGYLMFFNSDYGAKDAGNVWYNKGNDFKYISVVFSKKPYGPFVPLADKYKTMPVYDFSKDNSVLNAMDVRNKAANKPLVTRSNVIDAHPFIDPVTGDRYLYYSGYGNDIDGRGHGQTIFGVKMKNKNWLTPDYTTVKELTNLNKSQPGLSTDDSPEGQNVNEGAFVWYHNGKYYLTFSTYNFMNVAYQVRQAIADSPLGDFVKVKPADGGTLLETEVAWEGKIQSAGHHCFIQCGDELMIAYHSFYNRRNYDDQRAIAIDTISWVKNNDGLELMHTNGPTYSYQPLPEEISGYKNLAPLATVTSTNTAADSDVKYLTDGIVKAHKNDFAKEYETADGDDSVVKTEITFKFDRFVNARAVMVYNSIDYDKMFMNVGSITLKGVSKTRTIKNILFNYDWNVSSDGAVIPGAACIAEFAEMAVNEITVTMNAASGTPININEIKIIGKDKVTTDGSDFLPSYKFTPHKPVQALPYYESKTFGTVTDFFKPSDESKVVAGKDYNLYSSFGFDLTHDNDTDKYIDKYWAGNLQEMYFKEVKAVDLYVEVEMSVLDHTTTYNFDPYPKAGIVLRTKNKTFISYNIDCQSSFNNPVVGYVESNATGSDYNWDNYIPYPASGLKYTGNDKAKLGLARIGNSIYMFADGRFIKKEIAGAFDDTAETATAIGLVTFNCFMRYSNYAVITGRGNVVQKLAALGVTIV